MERGERDAVGQLHHWPIAVLDQARQVGHDSGTEPDEGCHLPLLEVAGDRQLQRGIAMGAGKRDPAGQNLGHLHPGEPLFAGVSPQDDRQREREVRDEGEGVGRVHRHRRQDGEQAPLELLRQVAALAGAQALPVEDLEAVAAERRQQLAVEEAALLGDQRPHDAPDRRQLLARKPNDRGLVFPSPRGALLNDDNFRHRVFAPAVRRTKLTGFRFHDLRHTFASLLLQNRESPAYVKEQMGHHSIKVTVDIYGHLVPGANRDAVDRLDVTGRNAGATARTDQKAGVSEVAEKMVELRGFEPLTFSLRTRRSTN